MIFPAVFLFASNLLRAERLPVKIYTSADGLGSSFVDYIMRDSRGFMWFCTRDGLSRFDGSRFVTYQIGEDSPPGIESIYETRDGMYWISTPRGIYRFDPNEISKPDAVVPRLNAEFMTDARGEIFEDSAGTLWLTSSPLSRLEQRDGKFFVERIKLNLPLESNADLYVADMVETGDGSLWFNSDKGLIRRLPDSRLIFYPVQLNMGAGNVSIMADKNGRIWLTQSNRLLVLKPEPPAAFAQSGELTVKSLTPTSVVELQPETNFSLPKTGGEIFQFISRNVNEFVENSYAKRIFQTSDGDVWVTAENFLMQFSDGVFHLHSSAEGLPNVMARMGEDAAGNLWIGGHVGLACLNRQGIITFGTAEGANSTRFFAINEAPDGTIYAAGRDFYVNRFDGNKFQAVRPEISPGSQFLWTSRFAFLASNGDWWILTSEKLYRFSGVKDFTELRNRQPSATYTDDDGLKATGMFQIFEDSEGNIWASTRGTGDQGNYLARLKKGEKKFHTFTKAENFPEGRSPSSFAEDNFGNLWIGFYLGGLARFDGERFELFDETDGLPAGLITDLHIDGRGRLWIGSALGGLLRLDDTGSKKPSFVRLTATDGLTSNNIRTITEDRMGRIYVGTSSGVDRISPDTGRIKHYSVNDGLAADFVVDSHCDKNGNLWFATNDGLSRLVPLPDEKISAPRILLGGLRIAGADQPISKLGDIELDKGELAPTENNLQIEFFGLDFRAGETLRYQYRLEGAANEDWSAPTEQRAVTYANLSPGTYRFLVRAVNSEGIVSEKPAAVSFEIQPPVWARWWFILLCALLATAAIILVYRYRTANLREINAALSEARRSEEELRRSREERIVELEKVRSRIATDLHDDIGASLTQIAVLSEVAQTKSKGNGATAQPLKMISSVSNELVETMSDIVWSINPNKDHLSDLSQRMRRFASDVLSAKGIGLHFDAPDWERNIIINTNLRREVFLIFKESVNNIVKHSGASHVRIELKVSDEILMLEISDDGKGFDDLGFGIADFGLTSEQPETRQSQIPNPKSFGGNGVLSIKRRAEEMNGELEIVSKIGTGTTVNLRLPLEKSSEASAA